MEGLPKADAEAGAPKAEVVGWAAAPNALVVPKAEGVEVEAPNALGVPKADVVDVLPNADAVEAANTDPFAKPAGSMAVFDLEVFFAISRNCGRLLRMFYDGQLALSRSRC